MTVTQMGWSDLPPELVMTIAGILTEFTDHLRFSSVCSHWRSSLNSHSVRLPPQVPLLTLPSTSTHFYSLSEDRVYSNPLPSIADNSYFFGSSSGWLLSVRGRYPHITFSLINPFTGASIRLPSPDPCLSLYYAMDTLVWDCSDSVVVATCSRRPCVFYCRLGEAAWASIESQQHRMATSITCYNGRFFILNARTCKIVVLDGETLEQITVIKFPDFTYSLVGVHLFVLSRKLFLLVEPTISLFPDGDLQFYEIRRANFNDGLVDWIDVHDIGDHALFVDNLHCFSVKVGDNDLLRRNCIYSARSKTYSIQFPDNGWRNLSMTYSISIFDLENIKGKRLKGALSKFRAASSCGAVSPPSWVLPSLSGGCVSIPSGTELNKINSVPI
ncbi:putative F-box protein At1g44080 [Carex rostrata]